MSGVKVERVEREVEYVLSFGDSQRPERYRFTEAEIRKLYSDLKQILYPSRTGP